MLGNMILVNIVFGDYKEEPEVIVVEFNIHNGLIPDRHRLINVQILFFLDVKVCDQVYADEVIFICGHY